MAAMSPLRIEGPPPVAPLYGLVTTPGVILNEEDEHWQGGVRVDSYPDTMPGQHDPCATGTFREKDVGSDPPMPEFSSFTIYVPMSCSGIGIGNEAGARLLRSRALVVFQAVEGFGVEQEFARGLANDDKPFLGDDQGDYLGTRGPREALALLELAIGNTARQGFIHADAPTAVMWFSYGLLEPAGGVLKTKRGNTVIIGDGYAGTESAAPGAPALGADNDQSYAFATGPVRVLRGEPVVHGPTREILDRTNNDVEILAERNYVAYWDTALQATVLVDRSTAP